MKTTIYNNSFIYNFFVNIKSIMIIVLLHFFRIIPIKNNRILIISYYGKEYGDNGKYVAEQLIKSNIDYEIFWALNNLDAELPTKLKKVKYKSLKYYYIISTSKVWINNCRFPKWIKKRKNQYYFQLWHGNIALKKIEFDAADKIGKTYIDSAKNDNNNIDYIFSNSTWCTNILYRGAFKYQKQILEYGTPRNDILINKDNKIAKKVKQHFNIDDTKVILYAPTFRKNYSGQYNIDFKKIIDKLEKKYNNNWIVLLRLHPNVRDNAKQYGITFNNKILDACFYDDMQELISSADLIITDYSSVMFDGMIANVPVVLYTTDLDNYNEERGTYFSLSELPFRISTDNKELISVIEDNSLNNLMVNYDSFKKKIGLKETGKASEKVSEIIDEITKK